MILVEECKLQLDDSVEPWLPELANRRVLKSISLQLDDTVPALRAITVRDVLTYRMGFGSVMAPPDTYPVQKLICKYRIGGDGPMLPTQAPSTDVDQAVLEGRLVEEELALIYTQRVAEALDAFDLNELLREVKGAPTPEFKA